MQKTSFGPAVLRRIEDARRACMEAATGATGPDGACRRKAPLFRDFVAGRWKADCFERCKPSTQKGFRSVLDRQLLPAFGARRLNRITRSMALG